MTGVPPVSFSRTLKVSRNYGYAACAVVAVHAFALTFIHVPVLSSDLSLEASVLVASFACFARRRYVTGAAQWKWILIAAGIFIWAIGQGISTYNEGLRGLLTQSPTAIDSDYYFFLFGIPLLLVMSSANERRRFSALLWIDGLQATVAVYLVHLQLFPGGTLDAISSVRMLAFYNTENVVLAAVALLRLLAKPSGEERNIYRVLTLTLCFYAIDAAFLNDKIVLKGLQTGSFYDLMWDLPFLLLTFLVIRLPATSSDEKVHDNAWAGLLVSNASPVFFTMALLVMGVSVERERFVAGVSAIAFALVSYGFRSSFIQSDAMRTEQKLLESESALVKANEQLEQLSFLDRLTGVANRRRFEETLTLEWNRTKRARIPLSLIVIDIDNFKLLNDRYGHLYGDECLVATAQALSACLQRAGELLARYGGEEFVAILPYVDEEHASALAERMRKAVESLDLANERAPKGRMTISLGVAAASDSFLRPTELFASADRALYQAKSDGRNLVRTFGRSATLALDVQRPQ